MSITTEGEYVSTGVIGGDGWDSINGVGADDNGSIYYAGSFDESLDLIDLDPGKGVDARFSMGENDAFVTRLNADGSYGWSWVVGSDGFDGAYFLDMHPDGGVIVGGSYDDFVNFDPAGEGDFHMTVGGIDPFIARLEPDGMYSWVYTNGCADDDYVTAMHVAEDGTIAMASSFFDEIDLDPTEAEDIHIDQGAIGEGYVTFITCADSSLPCAGDVNADSVVDPLDSGYVLARFGCLVGSGDPLCDMADANLDGIVDPLDVGFVMSRFGECE